MSTVQIHELAALNRNPQSSDLFAVDTGAVTAKVPFSAVKSAAEADALAAAATAQAAAEAAQSGADNSVKYNAAQTLTESQKATARGNIGAASQADMTTAENDIDALEALAGNTALPTTAQTLTGAIAEHESDISGIEAEIGDTSLPTTAQTVTGAIAEHETDIVGINGKIGAVPSGSTLQGEVDELTADVVQLETNALLLHDEIPNTTQTIAFDASGNVSTITHTNGSNVAVRTDAFTFAANSITEVRTLNTGEKLTIITNTTTLATTVTYTAAA